MRRARLEVLKDILDVGKNPSTKTSIVYKANLSFEQAKKYLEMLKEDDLMETHKSSHEKYETTEKGKDFLKNFEELEGLLPTMQTDAH